jgi:hypothetical protein
MNGSPSKPFIPWDEVLADQFFYYYSSTTTGEVLVLLVYNVNIWTYTLALAAWCDEESIGSERSQRSTPFSTDMMNDSFGGDEWNKSARKKYLGWKIQPSESTSEREEVHTMAAEAN